jgi:hypothetical protein
VRIPGATVFENEERKMVEPSESSKRRGIESPSNRSSPYGVVLEHEAPAPAARSRRRRRFSSESVRPLGFWKVGIV